MGAPASVPGVLRSSQRGGENGARQSVRQVSSLQNLIGQWIAASFGVWGRALKRGAGRGASSTALFQILRAPHKDSGIPLPSLSAVLKRQLNEAQGQVIP